MEKHTYEELFNFFRAVAFQKYPELAVDKSKCEEIFHDYFLYRILNSPTEPRQILIQLMEGKKGLGEEKNLLYTSFLNAIKDYLRHSQDNSRLITATDPNEIEEGTEVQKDEENKPAPRFSNEIERLNGLVDKILNSLTRDELDILTFIYVEGRRFEDLAKEHKVSKSTADRKEKGLRQKLKILMGEIDHDDFIYVVECLFQKIKREE